MKANQKSSRSVSSRKIRITPEFRKKPDVAKLGRALIDIAKSTAKNKETIKNS